MSEVIHYFRQWNYLRRTIHHLCSNICTVPYHIPYGVCAPRAYQLNSYSHKAKDPQWYQIFLRGIGCNWLVCIAVWVSLQSVPVRCIDFWCWGYLKQATGAKETMSKVATHVTLVARLVFNAPPDRFLPYGFPSGYGLSLLQVFRPHSFVLCHSSSCQLDLITVRWLFQDSL